MIELANTHGILLDPSRRYYLEKKNVPPQKLVDLESYLKIGILPNPVIDAADRYFNPAFNKSKRAELAPQLIQKMLDNIDIGNPNTLKTGIEDWFAINQKPEYNGTPLNALAPAEISKLASDCTIDAITDPSVVKILDTFSGANGDYKDRMSQSNVISTISAITKRKKEQTRQETSIAAKADITRHVQTWFRNHMPVSK